MYLRRKYPYIRKEIKERRVEIIAVQKWIKKEAEKYLSGNLMRASAR
jgi:5-bromo-4-chloroindolyl phosphate hydrolysis protein